MFEEHYFECACSDFDHLVRFELDKTDGEIFLSFRLVACNTWWKRVWLAVKYVFGKDRRYGEYDTTILREEDFVRLHALMDRASVARKQYWDALASRQDKPLLLG